MISRYRTAIAFRLFLIVLFFSVVLTLGIALLQTYVGYKDITAAVEEEIEEIQKSNSARIAASLWVMESHDVQLHLEGLLNHPYIEYLSIQKENRTISSAGLIKSRQTIRRDYPLYYRYNDKQVYLGTFSIIAGLDGARKDLFATALKRLLYDGILVFSISLLILFIVYVIVTRRLSTIAQHVAKLDPREAGVPLVIKKHFFHNTEDELDSVVNAINLMDKELHDSFYAMNREILDRRKAEEALKLNEDRLESLLKLTMMKVGSEKEITDFALEEVVRLTKSKGGYLHFFSEDKRTIHLYTWSKDVLKTCNAATDSHYPLDKAGIWADSVRLRKPVIHNDYQGLADKKGYPEGHFHLMRHLGAPIFDRDRIVGVMGVANKEEPYNDADAVQVSLFMNSMWRILKQKRTEEEREKLIVDLREALANVKQLSGMLPICASCKKIRDDKGYWSGVEAYITAHSEVLFSHGICPDCEKKMYKDLEKLKIRTREIH